MTKPVGVIPLQAAQLCVTSALPFLLQAMPELLNVVGRISFRDVWSYLEKVKQTPTKVRAGSVVGGCAIALISVWW